MALEDQPDYKLLARGSGSLTDSELISLIISGDKQKAVDTSRKLLNNADNCIYKLSTFSVNDLQRTEGITKSIALRLFASLELARRKYKSEARINITNRITGSKDIYQLMAPEIADLSHEEFHIILLNRANIIIKTVKISQGGIAGTVIDSRIILKTAIENLASNMIMVHNHPSGNLKPSDADIRITNKIKEASELIDIIILDHVIIAVDQYFSFADEGLL